MKRSTLRQKMHERATEAHRETKVKERRGDLVACKWLRAALATLSKAQRRSAAP